MLKYKVKANTFKNIDQLRYSLYSAISVNMLKYNHDSSAVIRVLNSFIDPIDENLRDLKHVIAFNFKNLDMINIDRLNAYSINGIPNFINGKTNFWGFSKYTGEWKLLKLVDEYKDFTRHSMPSSAFLSGKVFSGTPSEIMISPNTVEEIDFPVNNSSVTIKLMSGFSNINKEGSDPIKLTLIGDDIWGEEISEEISITTTVDYISKNRFSLIKGILLVNSSSAVEIALFPYILGDIVIWDKGFIDREELDTYMTAIHVDADSKELIISTIRQNPSEYPYNYDPVKAIPLEMEEYEGIQASFIDIQNELIYVTTSKEELVDDVNVTVNNLKCYPLIIPKNHEEYKILDMIKTEYQSMKIEYVDDSLNKKYTFYVFPSAKDNGIEFMHILINGEVHEEDILLDTIREGIETNRFEIPYNRLFDNTETALVEFRTYSTDGESNHPIIVENAKLKQLFNIKIPDSVLPFVEIPDGEYTVPSIKSSKIDYFPAGAFGYGEHGYGGILINGEVFGYGGIPVKNITRLYKLSMSGSILVDGFKIVNVYDSFYFDELEERLVTSDTITHIRALSENEEIADLNDAEPIYSYFIKFSHSETDISLINLEEYGRKVIHRKPVGVHNFT